MRHGMDQRPLWFHCLSYGEVKSSAGLVKQLANDLSGRVPLHLTASTATGCKAVAEMAGRIGASWGVLPFDLLPVVKRVVDALNPRCFVLMETDIWPNLIWYLSGKDLPVLLVNGSISERAAARLSLLPWAADFLYGNFSSLLMQSDHDRNRLLQLGIPAEKVSSPGNLKFDMGLTPLPNGDHRELYPLTGPCSREFTLVAGSTHHGEESILAQLFLKVSDGHGPFRMVVAPRDPARAHAVQKIFLRYGLDAALWSDLTPEQAEHNKVVVIDVLGLLQRLYCLADLAFVGGTMVPVGGHNLLEPAAIGVPVIYGQYVESIKEAADALVEQGGGFMVKDPEELFRVVQRLRENETARRNAGISAMDLVQKNNGITKRYADIIKEYLK